MTFLATLLLNGVYLFALLFSVYVASAWGEAAGHVPGTNKSGLGGFVFVFILMMVRWLGLALLLWAGVARGGFDELLPGARGRQIAVVLGAHLVLGVLSAWCFNFVVTGLTQDRAAPRILTALFGIVLPLPALFAAGYAIQRDWMTRHPRTAVLLALALVLLHVLVYRDRLRDMQRTFTPRATPEADAT